MAAPYNPKTPGITVSELPAFPPSVVGVATAIPAFIGYTQKANDGVSSVALKPTFITSLADYTAIFGGAPTPKFTLSPSSDPNAEVQLGGVGFTLAITPGTQLYLYQSLQLYFWNGGGPCYIVSVGSYAQVAANGGVKLDDFSKGLDAIEDQIGPTLLLAPDATLLAADVDSKDAPADPNAPVSTNYSTFAAQAADQAYTLKDRMVVLDVYGTDLLRPAPGMLADVLLDFADKFRSSAAAIDQDHRSYAAAYFPFLATNLIAGADLDFTVFELGGAAADLSKPAPAPSPPKPGDKTPVPAASNLAALQAALAKEADVKVPDRAKAVKDTLISKISNGMSASDISHVNKALAAVLPGLKSAYEAIALKLNVLPPSGAVAGVYVSNDVSRGVWEAPANMPLVGVVRPTLSINDAAQEDLNMPLNGMAINCIRALPGRGNLVWGARTLDGNSGDFRYVQVRRALIFLETSIKAAMNRFVFAGNVEQTWASVTAMIGSFLNGVWSQGGLMGGKATEAYLVNCGRPATMTGDDVLLGRMNVNVVVSLVHPAEFILLQFQQQMGGATTA